MFYASKYAVFMRLVVFRKIPKNETKTKGEFYEKGIGFISSNSYGDGNCWMRKFQKLRQVKKTPKKRKKRQKCRNRKYRE